MDSDPKQVEAEMRQKREILDAKYRNLFVREVVSKKGTEEVSKHIPSTFLSIISTFEVF